MMMSDNKDDHVMEDFSFGEDMSPEELERFIHNNRDNFYSKNLAEYLFNLPDISEGIEYSDVYKNNKLQRYEYWLVMEDRTGLFVIPKREMIGFCLYGEKMFGFSKWMQEMDDLRVPGTGYIGPKTRLN